MNKKIGAWLEAPLQTETNHSYSTTRGCQLVRLATEIRQNGGHGYVQAWRDEHSAVYEQYGESGTFLGYEAIAIKFQPAKTVFGRSYPDKEIYPCSEDWGRLGLTKNNLSDAIEAAKRLAKNYRKPVSSSCIPKSKPRRAPDGSRPHPDSGDIENAPTFLTPNFAGRTGTQTGTIKETY